MASNYGLGMIHHGDNNHNMSYAEIHLDHCTLRTSSVGQHIIVDTMRGKQYNISLSTAMDIERQLHHYRSDGRNPYIKVAIMTDDNRYNHEPITMSSLSRTMAELEGRIPAMSHFTTMSASENQYKSINQNPILLLL